MPVKTPWTRFAMPTPTIMVNLLQQVLFASLATQQFSYFATEASCLHFILDPLLGYGEQILLRMTWARFILPRRIMRLGRIFTVGRLCIIRASRRIIRLDELSTMVRLRRRTIARVDDPSACPYLYTDGWSVSSINWVINKLIDWLIGRYVPIYEGRNEEIWRSPPFTFKVIF